MRFVDIRFYREHWFSVGRDCVSGRFYCSFPVSNGVADYEEYYAIPEAWAVDSEQHMDALKHFANECRLRQHDTLLLEKPGSNRGSTLVVDYWKR